MKRTPRGFKIYTEFTDLYGNSVHVQQSSLATKKAVWIFSRPGPHWDTVKSEPSPHLTVAQAKRVIKGLQAFIEDNE